jgi:hypothetical protein
VYGTGTGDVRNNVARCASTDKASSLELLEVSPSRDRPDAAGGGEDGRREDGEPGDEGDGENAPGTEDRSVTGLTLRVVPAKCATRESGSMK